DLTLVDYNFSPLPFFGADQTGLQSSREKQQWIALHEAMDIWDVETSREALAVLKQSVNGCVASFATDLERKLMVEGEAGFQHVNPIKQHYINTNSCQLPLVSYEFSPLDFATLSSVDMATLWAELHNAVEVWDIGTAQQTLGELRRRAATEPLQEEQCVTSFANQLEGRLARVGTEGFRGINLIKTALNNNESCALPVVSFSFAPITPMGQGPDVDLSANTWARLHSAIARWDLGTSQTILAEMSQSSDSCISGFATTLQRELDVAGQEGFRQINPVKQRYNNALNCALPLVYYAFSPLS
ncbi:MAG: hypothetical protein AAFQ61_11790, partial [Cyanobacteria bacterium J06626_23]